MTGPTRSAHPSQRSLVIPHTVANHIEALPESRYRLTVKATAKNVSPVEAVFEASIDNNGELQCASDSRRVSQ